MSVLGDIHRHQMGLLAARVETSRQAIYFQIAALLIFAYCLYGAATGHLWFPAKSL
jgi:hypothetical protein